MIDLQGMKVCFFGIFAIACCVCCSGSVNYPDGDSRYQPFSPDGVSFSVCDNPWEVDLRGNHRAVVNVEDAAVEAVVVDILWRRPDLRIGTKKVIVTDAGNNEIKEVAVLAMDSELGKIAFKPVAGAGIYYIYYLPYKFRTGYGDARYGQPWNDYVEPDYDEAWGKDVAAKASGLPKAALTAFESRSKFDFWSPMGLIATQEEIDALKAAAGTDMVVFPEDRAYPIQFRHTLPWKLVSDGLKDNFKGSAMRNEYYVWQFGVWAAGKALENVKVSFDGLRNGRSVIGASEMTCFNQEGTNWDGSRMEIPVNVENGCLQALWCGVMIPENARPGRYEGTATISADGVDPHTVKLVIKVTSGSLADHGDADLWRHARLRWLNSTIAMDNEPTKDYAGMTLEGNVIGASGREVVVGKNGMVQTAGINDIEIFEAPQQFVVSTGKGDVVFSAENLDIHQDSAGLVSWTASSIQDDIKFICKAHMEFDGYIHYVINVSSDADQAVRDVKLVTRYSAYASEYFMGAGVSGGFRPQKHVWDWTGPFDSYWIGGPLAGMHTEFRGGTYHGPLIADVAYSPDPTPVWSNNGLGRVIVSGAKGAPATVVASTGVNSITRDGEDFEFDLLITPVKTLDPAKHFSEKYFHARPADFDRASLDGANISNIHHAGNLNPYINYPFIVRDSLKMHINHQHENGRKVKLYYTIRELTTHSEEVYAFKSLNHEVFAGGVGYGLPWECEHLIDDYKPAWYTSLEDLPAFLPDAALVLTGNSRFINYWLEGLRWMEENYDLDGIYMDDVSFDRTTVKRIRKILDRYHDGSLIDLHSNTAYSKGPANQYTEFFPYVNRLWFGESFKYDLMTPDEWFVTFSGIPFGEMSEMLQDGGNRFLGMVYGATARHSWSGTGNDKSPVPMWKFWDEFGIKDAEMIGYWDPRCPVSMADPEVKATVYAKDDSILVSIGNFGTKDKIVSIGVDWKALGMDPETVKITAPAINNFQETATFVAGQKIPVKAKEGWLIVISK